MTDTTTKPPFNRRVVFTAPRRDDLEVHVCAITLEGVPDGDPDRYVEIREFIPSIGDYGRGILVPNALAESLATAISTTFREEKDSVRDRT